MLEYECDAARARVLTGTTIHAMKQAPAGDKSRFVVETSAETFRAASVVVATGGLSIPKMGATDFGYRIAQQFGLAIVPCRPALVPFVF